ncbi:MAG: hypothetical protein ACOCT7_00455 [Candidatus Saliniplasma sp.]
MPEETYEIEAEFHSTYMLTSVDVNETATMVLSEEPEEIINFEDYPIPFYRTNLFIFIVLLVLLVAVIAYVYKKKSIVPVEEGETIEDVYDEDVYDEDTEPDEDDLNEEDIWE